MNPSRDELRDRLRQHLHAKKHFRTDYRACVTVKNDSNIMEDQAEKKAEAKRVLECAKALQWNYVDLRSAKDI